MKPISANNTLIFSNLLVTNQQITIFTKPLKQKYLYLTLYDPRKKDIS